MHPPLTTTTFPPLLLVCRSRAGPTRSRGASPSPACLMFQVPPASLRTCTPETVHPHFQCPGLGQAGDRAGFRSPGSRSQCRHLVSARPSACRLACPNKESAQGRPDGTGRAGTRVAPPHLSPCAALQGAPPQAGQSCTHPPEKSAVVMGGVGKGAPAPCRAPYIHAGAPCTTGHPLWIWGSFKSHRPLLRLSGRINTSVCVCVYAPPHFRLKGQVPGQCQQRLMWH